MGDGFVLLGRKSEPRGSRLRRPARPTGTINSLAQAPPTLSSPHRSSETSTVHVGILQSLAGFLFGHVFTTPTIHPTSYHPDDP